MRDGHSEQFGVPCVIIETGDTADDVINRANEIGARYDDGEDNMVVADFNCGVGSECYTERALRHSLNPHPGQGRMPSRWPIISTTNPRRYLG